MWCGAAAHGDRFRTSVPGADCGSTIVGAVRAVTHVEVTYS